MYKKIQAEIKSAMVEKNQDKKDVLRQVMAKAQMAAKEQKKDITDEIILSAVQKELKQLNQTKESVPADSSLYKSTLYKMSVLQEYMPKQMAEDDVYLVAKGILDAGEYKSFGEKMKAVMSDLKGKADSKLISDVVKKLDY